MHFGMGIFVILLSLKWANWKEWERYYPTILYMVASNLIYKLFALSKFHLWKLSSHDFFFNSHLGIFVWHLLIVNTLCTFIYLSNFPEGNWVKKSFYILKWTVIYILCESLLLMTDHVNYYNGWNIGWTILFDIIMFLMLRLHFKKPLWAIILSIPNTLFYLVVFGYFD